VLLEEAPSQTWYVWGLLSEHGTYSHLAPGRGTGVLEGLLKDYQGAVVCDGYAFYQAVAKEHPGLVLCFCWAHVRRAFWEARTAYPACEEALPTYTGRAPAERAEVIEISQRDRASAIWIRI
jgi:hypothetical protein